MFKPLNVNENMKCYQFDVKMLIKVDVNANGRDDDEGEITRKYSNSCNLCKFSTAYAVLDKY